MALLTGGYWHTTYWPNGYWATEYPYWGIGGLPVEVPGYPPIPGDVATLGGGYTDLERTVLGMIGEHIGTRGTTTAAAPGDSLPSGGGYSDLERTVLALIGER